MDDPPVICSPEPEVRVGQLHPAGLGIWVIGPQAAFPLGHDLLPACGYPFPQSPAAMVAIAFDSHAGLPLPGLM